MQVSIIAPDKSVYSGSAYSVTVPSVQGSFTALENHAPIVSILEKGVISVQEKEGGEKLSFNIKGGFVEISDNVATACIELDSNER
ncbi:MAG: F0F1 ATP synthase subunit epsilon [Paludibacteraceae bacterium]|nr:F0F1 ATP synthase subunit epsilon [Paludibacteraceae bacterium]